jgi:hypothetical protein
MAATLAGIWEHRYMLKAILDKNYRYADRPAIARLMGYALLAVGATALLVILFGL